MTFFILYEGQTSNDNAANTTFKSKAKAVKAFEKSSYPYAVIHQYEGTPGETENYQDTIAEKGAH